MGHNHREGKEWWSWMGKWLGRYLGNGSFWSFPGWHTDWMTKNKGRECKGQFGRLCFIALFGMVEGRLFVTNKIRADINGIKDAGIHAIVVADKDFKALLSLLDDQSPALQVASTTVLQRVSRYGELHIEKAHCLLILVQGWLCRGWRIQRFWKCFTAFLPKQRTRNCKL